MTPRRLSRFALALIPVFSCLGADAPRKIEFFAMDTASGELPPSAIRELGYDGVSLDFHRDWPLAGLDREKLTLFAVYGGISIDDGAGSKEVETAIGRLKGRPDTVIWLTLNSSRPRSSAGGDRDAVARLKPLADLARANGLRIAIYPHAGMWVERVGDAVRVANRLDHPAVGVTFNLCHFLKTEKAADLPQTIQAAAPRLFRVTINGADPDGTDWDRLIQPLDRGSFDIKNLIALLRKSGYRGPIGLQGYGVPGDKRTNLERSMRRWKALGEPAW